MGTKGGAKDYTYVSNSEAFLGEEIVTVPDQIEADQRYHDRAGTVFPARRRHGRPINVRLDGDAYGLWASGTGDMRLRSAASGRRPHDV